MEVADLDDILKKLCKNLKIKLVYTNNKVSILSCSTSNNHPVIRAHKMFKECKEEIANAVVEYYTKTQNKEENLKIIKDYANIKFISHKYKIIPPGDEFYNSVKKITTTDVHDENNKSALVELDISSMTKKNLCEKAYEVNLGETIKTSENDILEVNIIVNPFNT